jgi:Fe-S cluster biogenesis protein NfuA/nitrite reductase/ring-hydroxylating ferredoxin subunit
VEALLEFYGEALARFVGYVSERDPDGSLARAVAEDGLVAHMLLIHGLHPVPVEERVRGALAEVAPYLGSHGGGVELVGVEDGIARVRLEGACSGCPSSRVTLKLAVEDAVMKACPDLAGVEAEGVEAGDGLLRIEVSPSWAAAGSVAELGAPQMRDVRGEPVLFLRVGGEDYAYRPACPACGATLTADSLDGGEVVCRCGARYDVRRAGMALDGDLQLEPVPLLVDPSGNVTVALGGR